mgnify:CR=1 FL=1
MKYCPKCKTNKSKIEFGKAKGRGDGLRGWCKLCTNAATSQWQKNNPEKMKARKERFYQSHEGYEKEYYAENKGIIKSRAAAWYAANKQRHIEYLKKWNEINPKKRREYSKTFNRKFRSTHKGNLSSTISKRMNESLRKGMKAGRHWELLVNFTIEQLKIHIEKLFKPGMTWENYGTAWHIDHKIPIAAFNFETPDDIDFRLCWSLKNLQPLEATKNRSKGAKLDKPFQPSLAIAMHGG